MSCYLNLQNLNKVIRKNNYKTFVRIKSKIKQQCFQSFIRIIFFLLQYHKRTEFDLNPERKLLSTVPCDLLLKLFPFGILLNPDMHIVGCGEKILEVWTGKGSMLGEPVTKYFKVRRPKGIPFTWNNVILGYIFYCLMLIAFFADSVSPFSSI